MRENIRGILNAAPKVAVNPAFCKGWEKAAWCLDGEWEVLHGERPEEEIGNASGEGKDGFRKILVPSDMSAHRDGAFTGRYLYRTWITVPRMPDAGCFVLKMEGVNGHAQVWLDGKLAAEHENGFVSWSVDVTEHLAGKEKVLLNVLVDENIDRVCCFNHGGILHSVWLYGMPEAYLDGMYLCTTLDEKYENAVLKAGVSVYGAREGDQVRIEAFAPEGDCGAADRAGVALGGASGKTGAAGIAPDSSAGKTMAAAQYSVTVAVQDDGTAIGEIFMENPVKWDAEHPDCYRAVISVVRDGEVLERAERLFGVRQIDRKENRLYVNGREVKLHGVCRHEITPDNGRAVTREWIEKDVKLFKEANCNYIRTSHYPPSEYFLELCDRKGIYVEDELDLAFIAKTTPYFQRDPAYREKFRSVFLETFARDYSHPSVLIWSMGNEAFGGAHYDANNRLAHELDGGRPTKFSYPMTMQAEHEPVDIWSIHYANVDGEMDKKRDNVSVGYTEGHDVPVLNDEYVHIPCYNRTELRRDPNVRNFWGESLRLFTDRIWQTKGALGGAIWAGIDETDLFTETRRQEPKNQRHGDTCLEWGIIDVWRRPKPEHYLTRKAYTPVRIREKTFQRCAGGVRILAENRFCHTNFSEVRVRWGIGEDAGRLMQELFGPDLEPGKQGSLEIPMTEAEVEEAAEKGLYLEFLDARGNQVDEYLLRDAGRKDISQPEGEPEVLVAPTGETGKPLQVEETPAETIVKGEDFSFYFSAETGLLTKAEKGGEILLMGGPCLHVPYLPLGPWKLARFDVEMRQENAVVTIHGVYEKSAEVRFKIEIRPDGTFTTNYKIGKLLRVLPKEMKLRVGVDAGGLDELGISYLAAPGMDSLSWNREGSCTIYPKDHIGRNHGTARRWSKGSTFAVQPEIPWGMEEQNYILNGPYDPAYRGTADFRSLKENIYEAALYREEGKAAILVHADGNQHVRAEVQEPEDGLIQDTDGRIAYEGTWYAKKDAWGNFADTETTSCEKGAAATVTFHGTGIVWYGAVDTICGIARVWLDGHLADGAISQLVAGVDFPGSAAGYDRKYRYPLYSVTGLEDGEHTLRIEVTGEKETNSQNCYINIDCFRILGQESTEPVELHLLDDFNYPQISWGNYKKPGIRIADGYEGWFTMELRKKIL
ncbi:MAG: glycoside hydrolase family 2 TIM barrel-domain containing protein [Eubacteriales bacterium]|nr:glycoside hydrolase family 2 TIM barrel-domain containing protein [Eubacteriales bacterium]